MKGKFLVFDGPDGSGKTTQRDLLAKHLSGGGLDVICCKDPGGSEIGDRVRHILLDYDLSSMDVRCETMLFMASRAQLIGEIVDPALAAGKVVLCDRFVSSTCAYQSAAGYPVDDVIKLAPFAIGNTWPDLTFVLDVDVDAAFQRTGRKTHHAGKHRKQTIGQHSMFADALTDAMEARPVEFHRRVRDMFLALPKKYPSPVHIIDTNQQSADDVHQQVLKTLSTQLSERSQ